MSPGAAWAVLAGLWNALGAQPRPTWTYLALRTGLAQTPPEHRDALPVCRRRANARRDALPALVAFRSRAPGQWPGPSGSAAGRASIFPSTLAVTVRARVQPGRRCAQGGPVTNLASRARIPREPMRVHGTSRSRRSSSIRHMLSASSVKRTIGRRGFRKGNREMNFRPLDNHRSIVMRAFATSEKHPIHDSP